MYLDEAMELDRKVGQLLAALEADGLASNTLVVFFADNGAAHVRAKQFCYDSGLHCPLILRWPAGLPPPERLAPGRVDDRLIHGIDLAPTMLALAGLPKPPAMQGRVFLGPQREPDREFVFGARDRCDETMMRIRTVCDRRYRYIRNCTPETPLLAPNAYKERRYPVGNLLQQLNAEGKLTPAQAFLSRLRMPDEELYALERDPHEMVNLAESPDPEHRAVLARLREVLERWIEETNDQGRFPESPEAALSPAAQEEKRQPPDRRQP